MHGVVVCDVVVAYGGGVMLRPSILSPSLHRRLAQQVCCTRQLATGSLDSNLLETITLSKRADVILTFRFSTSHFIVKPSISFSHSKPFGALATPAPTVNFQSCGSNRY